MDNFKNSSAKNSIAIFHLFEIQILDLFEKYQGDLHENFEILQLPQVVLHDRSLGPI